MLSYPGSLVTKADRARSEIEQLEGLIGSLRIALDRLDQAELPVAAVHVCAAIDQLRLDVEQLKELAEFAKRAVSRKMH